MSGSIESVAGAATAAASAGVSNQVSTRVARLTLESAEQQGQALVSLIRSAGGTAAAQRNDAPRTTRAGLDVTA